MKKNDGMKYVILICFLAGIILGTLFTNASGIGYLEKDNMLQLFVNGGGNRQEKGYLIYLFISRIIMIAGIWTVLHIRWGRYLLWGVFTWFGFSFGVLVSMMTLLYEAKALAVVGCLLFPQWICYGLAVFFLIFWLSDSCIFPGGMPRKIRYNKINQRNEFKLCSMTIVVTIFGILSEYYLTPWLVTQIDLLVR